MTNKEKHDEIKDKLIDLMQSLLDSAIQMNGVAPPHEVRQVDYASFIIKTMLENNFDFHNTNRCNELEYSCKIADKYLKGKNDKTTKIN